MKDENSTFDILADFLLEKANDWRGVVLVVLLPTLAAFWSTAGALGLVALEVLFVAYARREGFLLDLLTLRSIDSRHARRVKLAARAVLAERACEYSSLKVSVGRSISLVISGDRTALQSVAGSIASRAKATGWQFGPAKSLGETKILLWMSDPLEEQLGLFAEDNFDDERGVLIGRDEVGSDVWLDNRMLSLLISGAPGRGKSLIGSFVVSAHHRGDRCLAIDLKGGIEFQRFEGLDGVFVIDSVPDALEALRELVSVMDRRYVGLKKTGKVNFEDAGYRKEWLVIDELQQLTNSASKPVKEESRELLGQLLAMGRAAGIVVVAGTQHASGEVISTHVRNYFQYRLSFFQTTDESWKMALGVALPDNGIVSNSPGVGFLRGEGASELRRIRTFEMPRPGRQTRAGAL